MKMDKRKLHRERLHVSFAVPTVDEFESKKSCASTTPHPTQKRGNRLMAIFHLFPLLGSEE